MQRSVEIRINGSAIRSRDSLFDAFSLREPVPTPGSSRRARFARKRLALLLEHRSAGRAQARLLPGAGRPGDGAGIGDFAGAEPVDVGVQAAPARGCHCWAKAEPVANNVRKRPSVETRRARPAQCPDSRQVASS